MSPTNVLIMIHGIIPSSEPLDHAAEYNNFFQSLVALEPQLSGLFAGPPITVEWGHELPNSNNLEDHRRLTRAQNFINEKTKYSSLQRDNHPNNSVINDRGNLVNRGLRLAIAGLRENLFITGMGDVIFYASADGEKAIRREVYNTILDKLQAYENDIDVRLHLVGHSLGVTLCHDFLYGLFASRHQSGFLREHQGSPDAEAKYELWHEKATNGELTLGSMTSTASQIAILAMRKQGMVDMLASHDKLKASDIGITGANPVKWQLFYDIDDVLAYGTRGLYDNPDAIREIQVDNNDNILTVHTSYWKNPVVIQETAQLLLENSR
ncbi:hypothetical protein [Acaryochloris sp. IP29b_bin.137]|uniref:hypothetical protein n=1 Tax=Acaryochloris sp. IP29b_bin.137 TaxID=2969217 RepID=UPI00261B1AC5|nr:hypothetical protein [Acaryochloris sp. IP29b_bin.137]